MNSTVIIEKERHMSVLYHFTDAELLEGVHLEFWDFSISDYREVSLKLFDDNGRQRLEMSPVFFPLKNGEGYQKAMEMALEIVADPKGHPTRPVGHVYAKNLAETFRWEEDYRIELLKHISTMGGWTQYRDDGGSVYSRLNLSGILYIQQVTKTQRILVGEVAAISLPTRWNGRDAPLVYKMVRRLVIAEGTEGRSPVGSTNLDFFGFVKNHMQ